jgi:hypothetical protein
VLREARTLLATPVALRTLNSHQDATVKAMAELILPKTDTPGATDVGASAFIDLMLTEWYDERDRTRFLNGLSEVDRHTKDLFDKNFVEATPNRQAEILAWLGEKMTAESDAMGTARRQRRGSQGASSSFYPMLRRLTLTAYYTSEGGATEELHFQVIPDSHAGCATIPPSKEGAEN